MSVAERGSSGQHRRPPLSKQIELEPLTCFVFLLAWQTLANQGSFGLDHVWTDPVWWATSSCLVLLLLRPSSLALLIVALTLNVIPFWGDPPFQVNHLLFEDVVNLTILSAIAVSWLRYCRGRTGGSTFNSRERRVEIFELLAPAVRVSVVLLYFFVTLAKLNDDFFDPALSCAAEMYRDISPLDLTNPLISWTDDAAIYGTLLAEAGIPVLLLFTATRKLGVVSGLCFHLMLAFHPAGGVFGFSAMMFAMLFLFTSNDSTAQVGAQLERLRQVFRNPRNRRLGTVLLPVGLFVVALAAATIISRERLPFFLWLLSALPLVTFFLVTLLRTGGGERGRYGPLFAKPVLLFVFPLFIILNGATPYLGLKTETALAMFSNLRTEDGVTNHLFIPAGWQLADYQRGLVEITESDLPELRELTDSGYLLTRFEFERILHHHDNFTVSCECYGTTLNISKENGVISGFDQQESFTPWLGSMLYFREVGESGGTPCSH